MKTIKIKTEPVEENEPSKESAIAWSNRRVTRYHVARLKNRLSDIQDNWVNGDYTGDSIEETNQLNAEALGKAQAIAETLVEIEEMQEDETSEEV